MGARGRMLAHNVIGKESTVEPEAKGKSRKEARREHTPMNLTHGEAILSQTDIEPVLTGDNEDSQSSWGFSSVEGFLLEPPSSAPIWTVCPFIHGGY